MKVQVIMLMAVASLLSACSSAPGRIQNDAAISKNSKEFIVDLKVDKIENVYKLLVTSLPQGDESIGKKNGWVGFPKGSHGIIRFRLADEEGKTGCTNDQSTSAVWVITEVVLSKWGKKDTQKGEKFGFDQPRALLHAFPTLTTSGYLVKNEPISTAQTSAILINLNNSNGDLTAYYEIEVQRCDGKGDPIRTDPGIGNRGK